MIEEALKSFWYAIYSNHLVIKIDNIEISSDNLDEHMLRRFPDEIDNTAKSGYLKPRPYYLAVREAGVSPKAKVFTENLPILGECTLYLIKSDTPKDKIIYMRRHRSCSFMASVLKRAMGFWHFRMYESYRR